MATDRNWTTRLSSDIDRAARPTSDRFWTNWSLAEVIDLMPAIIKRICPRTGTSLPSERTSHDLSQQHAPERRGRAVPKSGFVGPPVRELASSDRRRRLARGRPAAESPRISLRFGIADRRRWRRNDRLVGYGHDFLLASRENSRVLPFIQEVAP